MKNFNAEMIEKAKAAKSAEELLALANENGVEMTAAEAATYFAQLNPKSGELDDDDLDAVAGGSCSGSDNGNPAVGVGDTVQITSGKTCSSCGSNIGIAARLKKGAYIKCSQCGDAICEFNECTYIVIG